MATSGPPTSSTGEAPTDPFPSRSLATRIERVESNLMRSAVTAVLQRPDSAAFIRPLAGGVATFSGPGSPLNKVAGLGFAGPVAEEDLAEVEQLFAGEGVPTQVELSSMADPEVAALLTARGYRLMAFENVLGRSLRDVPSDLAQRGLSGVTIVRDPDFETWLAAVIEGFGTPDSPDAPPHDVFPSDVLERVIREMSHASGFVRYLATLDGEPAGAASMRLDKGVAQLAGAATRPAFRRRGVQSALLSRRLSEAGREGCDVAVVTTQPGSASHSNVHRFGFRLLYTRAILLLESPTS